MTDNYRMRLLVCVSRICSHSATGYMASEHFIQCPQQKCVLNHRVWTSRDLFLEKICRVLNGERQIYFWSCLKCAMDHTYNVYELRNKYISSQLRHFVIMVVKYHLVLCDSALWIRSSCSTYVTITNMAAASAQKMYNVQKRNVILTTAVMWKSSTSILQAC